MPVSVPFAEDETARGKAIRACPSCHGLFAGSISALMLNLSGICRQNQCQSGIRHGRHSMRQEKQRTSLFLTVLTEHEKILQNFRFFHFQILLPDMQ